MRRTSRSSVLLAMYAAIICVTGFVSVPFGPIPLVLQNVVAICAGLVFGLPRGAAAVGMFLAVGALGLPVFSGARSGFAVLSGPTGGFLVGYFIGALVAGHIAATPTEGERSLSRENIFRLARAAVAGLAFSYLLGVLNFRHITGTSFSQALSLCVLPFVVPDLLKLLVMVPLAARVRPLVARLMGDDSPGQKEG